MTPDPAYRLLSSLSNKLILFGSHYGSPCICLQSGAKPFTFADFLSLQRSINQDSEEQRRHEELRRRDERERDMKKFEILLGMHPT